MHVEFWVWGRETSLNFTINLPICILEVRHLLFTYSSNQRRLKFSNCSYINRYSRDLNELKISISVIWLNR